MNSISPMNIDKSADYQNKIQASFAEKVSQVKLNDPPKMVHRSTKASST